MGGCTITKTGDSIEGVLKELSDQIYGAIRAGLWVDSEVIVLNPETREVKIYVVKYTYSKDGRDPLPHSVSFDEIDMGRSFHVGVAAMYGPRPQPGEFVGTVHVHT